MKFLIFVILYYHPIVLILTTKHTFNSIYVWSPDFKMLQHFVCRTGQCTTELAKIVIFSY